MFVVYSSLVQKARGCCRLWCARYDAPSWSVNPAGRTIPIEAIPRPTPLNPKRSPPYTLLLLLAGILAILPFVAALGGPFIWDDNGLILNNPYVQSFSFLRRWFTHSYFDAGQPLQLGATYFRPFALASFALDWHWGSGNPTAFHATNILLQFITTIVAISALARWSARPIAALFAGLLFAWHPTKTESVAWISGRTDLLVALFILLACHARALRPSRPYLSVSLEGLATIGAYACKETAVVLPVFIAIETWLEVRRPPLTIQSGLSILRGCLGQILVSCSYLVARSCWLRIEGNSISELVPISGFTHVGLVLQTFGRAVQIAFLPLTQKGQHGLVCFNAQGRLQIDSIYALTGAIAVLVFAVLAVWSRRRLPLFTWGCLIFLVSWLPTSHVVPTHLACDLFERFLFLPLLGLALALLAIPKASVDRHFRVAPVIIIFPVLSFCAWRSYARTLDYADAHRFWVHENRVNPLSVVAPLGLLDSRTSAMPVASALALLDQCHRNATTRGQMAEAVRCAFDAGAYVADFSADLDKHTQTSAIEFFRAVEEGKPTVAVLDSPMATVRVDLTQSSNRAALESRRGEALSLLASLESRRRDARAADDARKAIAACSLCRYVPRAANALAACGDIQESLRALERLSNVSKSPGAALMRLQILQSAEWRKKAPGLAGPDKVHAEAQALLSIGLFGAAYEILRPHLNEFEQFPEIARDFARVALNAGNALEARKVLLKLLPSSEVDTLIDHWQKERTTVYPN